MAYISKYVWCIAYINKDHIDRIQEMIDSLELEHNVEAFIPTVKVLKKKFKGKQVFEYKPLLFNYGFFKMRRKDARNPDFLSTLRYKIPGIHSWVRDKLKDNLSSDSTAPRIATARNRELRVLLKEAVLNNIYDSSDIDKVDIGDYVTLKGYPFDSIQAQVLHINHKKEEIKVKLNLDNSLSQEVIVSFKNVFYTIYDDFNEEETRTKSYDEMVERYGSYMKDKLFYNNTEEE